jgi:hypothetical protein
MVSGSSVRMVFENYVKDEKNVVILDSDYFRGIGDTLHSSKTKVSSCQNNPTRP